MDQALASASSEIKGSPRYHAMDASTNATSFLRMHSMHSMMTMWLHSSNPDSAYFRWLGSNIQGHQIRHLWKENKSCSCCGFSLNQTWISLLHHNPKRVWDVVCMRCACVKYDFWEEHGKCAKQVPISELMTASCIDRLESKSINTPSLRPLQCWKSRAHPWLSTLCLTFELSFLWAIKITSRCIYETCDYTCISGTAILYNIYHTKTIAKLLNLDQLACVGQIPLRVFDFHQ